MLISPPFRAPLSDPSCQSSCLLRISVWLPSGRPTLNIAKRKQKKKIKACLVFTPALFLPLLILLYHWLSPNPRGLRSSLFFFCALPSLTHTSNTYPGETPLLAFLWKKLPSVPTCLQHQPSWPLSLQSSLFFLSTQCLGSVLGKQKPSVLLQSHECCNGSHCMYRHSRGPLNGQRV